MENDWAKLALMPTTQQYPAGYYTYTCGTCGQPGHAFEKGIAGKVWHVTSFVCCETRWCY